MQFFPTARGGSISPVVEVRFAIIRKSAHALAAVMLVASKVAMCKSLATSRLWNLIFGAWLEIIMTKKTVPIWLEDKAGNQYHMKVHGDNEWWYIVDAVLDKPLTFPPVAADFEVGRVWECEATGFSSYRVVRNELLQQ